MPFNADNNQNNQNDPNKDQNQDQINLKGSGQGAASTPNSGRVANYSTGQQTGQTSGSGRFNNLQKYISANQGAGENMGAKIGNSFNKNLDYQKTDFDKKNTNINMGLQQGQKTLDQGSGFQTELSDIEKGFKTFKSMDDRSGFDAASQSAKNFANNENFSKFQTIQSGAGIDNDRTLADASGLVNTGQNLNTFTQDKLNKIQTEQGRFDLLNSAYGNKKNYGAGSARFDQLLLQNTPGNVVKSLNDQFNTGNLESKQLLNTANTQSGNVNTLLDKETDLVTGLTGQSSGTQNAFNNALYGGNLQNNIKQVNDSRQQIFDEMKTGLKTRNLTAEQKAELGLTNINKYDPRVNGTPVEQFPGVSVMGSDDLSNSSIPNGPLSSYNLLNDPDAWNQYTKQGKSAVSAQDITTDDDFSAYNALKNISGKDTGVVGGSSQLGKSILQGDKNLATDITTSNNNFKALDESGGLKGKTGDNPYGYGYNAESGDLSSILNLQKDLEARGLNSKDIGSNFKKNGYTNRAPIFENIDLLNKYLPQSNFAPRPGAVWSDDPRRDSGMANLQTKLLALDNAQKVINEQGYYNDIATNATASTAKRYKGLF